MIWGVHTVRPRPPPITYRFSSVVQVPRLALVPLYGLLHSVLPRLLYHVVGRGCPRLLAGPDYH